MQGVFLFALSFLLPPDHSIAKAHRRSWPTSKCVRWSSWVNQRRVLEAADNIPHQALRNTTSQRQALGYKEPQQTMEMSDVQAVWAELQLRRPFPRKHAHGLQQEHQHLENPFNKPPNPQLQQMKGWRRTVIIPHHKRISCLTKRIWQISFFKCTPQEHSPCDSI